MPITLTEIVTEFSKDNLIYWFVPIFFLGSLLEYIYGKKHQLNLHLKEDSQASLWMMFYVVIVDIIPKFSFFALAMILHEISPLRDVIQRQWWAWVLLFFLDDFIYYWFHRLNHEVRIFWAGHVNHHSAVRMHYVTALRQGVGERVHKYLFWMPLPLLGFDALMVFLMMSINLFYQFWTHTETIKRLPKVVEFFMNTPSHHRVHHASNIRYLDCNHAGVFIIWDRLFGTFSEENEGEAPCYGLTTNLESQRPVNVLTHEYKAIYRDVKRASRWQDKLKYIFLSPGWSHDGPDMRARTLRANALEAESHTRRV